MEDITPGLLQKIQKDFQSKFDKSKAISELYKKVRDGTATYSEANKFAIKVGEILSNAFRNNISSDVLPNGRMYYNIAKGILEPTLTRNHELITDVTSRIQATLNKSANIGIKAITPEVNQSRIDGLIDKVSDAEVYDDVAWVLDEPVVNFSQSVVDDAVKTNAEFQHKSGLSPQIIRTSSGKCCEWCSNLVGTYEYGDVRDTGNNVFRRHSNCRCEVTFRNGRKRQDVWSKQKWIVDDEILAERKTIGIKSASVETPKEREKRVANSAQSSTIKEKDILIHRSLGAKALNHDVELPDGTYTTFTQGTRITNITTIAGKGRNRQIDEVDILVDKYGGEPQNWQKKKGIGYLDYEGESYKAEVHWYEEPKAGKHKFKAKSRNGEWIIDE